MDEKLTLKRTENHIKTLCFAESSGHDWSHIERVRKLALVIGAKEGADLFVVELGALLHDIADWKFHKGDENIGPQKAAEWLNKLEVSQNIVEQITAIIREISFKGSGVTTQMSSLEGKVVQDADRLDAIGAIGIARAFAYGGFKGRPMYDPAQPPELHATFDAYKNSSGGTINHFYEKLLLLKERLNTKTARDIAAGRHAFMEEFLNHFFAEWNFGGPTQ